MDAVLGLVGALVNALIIGVIARRLLGTPVGWPRTLLLSLIMVAALTPGMSWLLGLLGWRAGVEPDDPTGGALVVVSVLVLAWALVAEVVILVIAEAIAPTGTVPGPVQLVRSWRARRRRTRRMLAVVAILARHGLAGYLRPIARREPQARVARSLREALTEIGVTAIKLGQMLATRPDLVPEPFVTELSRLHSTVEPVPWEQLEPILTAELGRPTAEVFAELDPVPLAAASVAQIHAARLIDGTEVVVKIQRPDASAQAVADLDILQALAVRLEHTTTWARDLGVADIVDGFARSLLDELDYRVELASMAEVAGASDAVDIPTTHPDLSSGRVLVMQRMPGRALSEASELIAALTDEQRRDAADRLFTAVLHQIMITGVFHADLHPGNIMIDTHGRVGLLDFGSVGRLDRASRAALGALVLAAERGDAVTATDALLELLDRPAELDDRAFEREVGQLVLRFRGGVGSGGSAAMFARLITVVVRHRFAVPAPVTAAFRALGALEGSLRLLTADLDLIGAARAEGRAMIADQLKPEAVRSELEAQVGSWLPLLQRLPRRLNRITEQAETGRLTVGIRLFAEPTERSYLTGLVHQLISSVLAAALAVCGVLLLTSPLGPTVIGELSLFALLGATLLLFAFALAARVLVLVFTTSGGRPRTGGSRGAE